MDDAPKRGRPAGVKEVFEVKPIGLEIECEAKDKDKAAEIAYMENMDDAGGVMVKNPVCGGSAYFKSFENFPKVNMLCTCGQRGHLMVKYTFSK